MTKRIVLSMSNTSEWDDAHDYLSKSRVVLFHKTCQIKYRKQYIEKCIPYEETHATTIGSRYHNFMELFMAVADKYPTDQWHTFIHPDFTEEEIPMLKWTIDLEIERYKTDPELWRPIALEYQIVDHAHKLRGIIDRIDQVDDSTINIIEYKTSRSHDKSKLQMEFGFYDLLLDAVPELEGYKRKYTVIYPRFQKVIELNPSRRATTEKRIKDIFDAIENDSFKPACGLDVDTMQLGYKYGYCTICTLEEIAAYNGINQYLPS